MEKSIILTSAQHHLIAASDEIIEDKGVIVGVVVDEVNYIFNSPNDPTIKPYA